MARSPSASRCGKRKILRFKTGWIQFSMLAVGLTVGAALLAQDKARPSSYAPVDIHEAFATTMNRMSAAKAGIVARQMAPLAERYDLGDRPSPGRIMSRNKPGQQGGRLNLAAGLNRERLGQTP